MPSIIQFVITLTLKYWFLYSYAKMGHVYDDRLTISLEELGFNAENGSNRGRMGRRSYDDDAKTFKSKNLEYERKRREKLSTRLLMLRSLVPIVTNVIT